MGRPGRRAVPKREVVFEAARELFLAEGYAAVSMDRLAARARVSKATVYTCFESKEAAFEAVTKWLAAGVISSFDETETLAGRPEVALPAFGMRYLRMLSGPWSLGAHRLWAAEAGRLDGSSKMFEAQIAKPVQRALARYLAGEVGRGTLAIKDARLAAAQLLGLLKEPIFWPQVLGVRSMGFRPKVAVAGACEVFLRAYALSH
jgi:TetR/AcrR family transcriptional regulator of autoinduction and epiphytic fitness